MALPLFIGEGPKHVVKAIEQQLGLIDEGNCPSARRAQGKTDFFNAIKARASPTRLSFQINPEWDASIKNCLRYDLAQKPSATLPRCETACIIFHAHTMVHRGRNG